MQGRMTGSERRNGGNFWIRDMVLCALFAALIAVGAFIRVPLPAVPFTLQTLFVLLGGMLLGGKRALISVGIYIVLGLLGLPIFTQGGGIAYVLQPTFGYILGFALCAYVCGKWIQRQSRPGWGHRMAGGLLGLACVYAVGLPYFYAVTTLYVQAPVTLHMLAVSCCAVFLPGDIASCALAAMLAYRLQAALPQALGHS